MTKTILGNTKLNNTCSRILQGNSTVFKNIIIMMMLIMSMMIIMFEIISKKIKPAKWNINLPVKKKDKTSLNPINKLA